MKQENYVIGLDIGINNVGWSILNLDNNKIEKTGVRLFNPSLTAEDRRNARSVRRRSKRTKNRINDSIKLFRTIGFEEKRCIDNLLIEKRIKGLKEQIDKKDIINIVCYFMEHRGYISFDDEEVNFVDLEGKYPCEYYYNLYKSKGKYRALDETVKNSELKKELKAMLEKQAQFYPKLNSIVEELLIIFSRKREFWEGPGSIKSFTSYGRFKSEDDVKEYLKNKEINSSYEKYLFEDLISKCSIYLNEKSAPKANFYAQKFNLINDFVNLTFLNVENVSNMNFFVESKNGYKLSQEGIEALIDYCINYEGKALKIDTLLKDLYNLKKESISGFRKDRNDKIEMSTFDDWRVLKRVSSKFNEDNSWLFDSIEKYNKFIYYVNVSPNSVKLFDMVKNDIMMKDLICDKNKEFIQESYKILKNSNRLGYHSLSEKALIRACNDMISTQMNFQQVRKKFDYDKEKREFFSKKYIVDEKHPKMTTEYIDEIIASPQVKKSLRQAIKIINAVIEEKGGVPYCIAIESTKELNSKDKKKEIESEQKKNEILRKKAIQIITENGVEITEKRIEKVMLYEEINGRCPYCNEAEISLKDVLDNRIEVEHILPLSKSMDNSFNNKTLSCQKCNSSTTGKGNKTPYEWKKNTDFDDFANRVKNYSLMSDKKKSNLLFEDDIDRYSLRFINRNLSDTAYATTELVKQINLFNYFLYDQYKLRINTLSTPGQITSKIRKDNNLLKNRDDGKYHHAVDASIVASIANTDIGRIIISAQNNDQFWMINKKNIANISEYLHNVNVEKNIDDIKSITNENIYISSQVLRKNFSSLSNANIVKYIRANNCLNKISQIDNIYEEKNDNLEKIFDENSSAILMIKDNNPKLYYFMKNILEEYKDKQGNAFKNYCFDKHRDDEFITLKDFDINKHGIHSSLEDTNSPIVKKLKYYSKVNNPFLLNKESINKKDTTLIGLDSLSQFFTEIYYDVDNNKFAFLPIYSISVNLKTNKVNRENEFYKKMKAIYLPGKNYIFITRIYNGNLVKIKKKDESEILSIYSSFHKTNNKLIFKDNSTFTTNDISLTIYDVDVLGNKKERLTFKIK